MTRDNLWCRVALPPAWGGMAEQLPATHAGDAWRKICQISRMSLIHNEDKASGQCARPALHLNGGGRTCVPGASASAALHGSPV